jgi:hypothetical protein
MTASLAFVVMAVQYFFAFFTALKNLPLFAAFYSSLRFSTLTSDYRALEVTRLAFSTMTDIGAIMWAISSTFFPADLSTGMRL